LSQEKIDLFFTKITSGPILNLESKNAKKVTKNSVGRVSLFHRQLAFRIFLPCRAIENKMNPIKKLRICLLPLLLLISTGSFAQTCILISKSYGEKAYEKWLLRHEKNLKLVSAYHLPKDSLAWWMEKADGFLMTGGEDIYPARYGQEKDTVDCGDFDLRRDSLEFRLLDAAFRRNKPVFGVCRGLQLINVYQGGSLVVDIPTSALGKQVAHRNDGPVEHSVRLIPGAELMNLARVDTGLVLSNHHQGISRLGKDLKKLASSQDGLIEAICQSNRMLPFLMAVQWHPERMDAGNPLSAPLASAFIEACLQKKE
jgi:putative glutamine amidotransferase